MRLSRIVIILVAAFIVATAASTQTIPVTGSQVKNQFVSAAPVSEPGTTSLINPPADQASASSTTRQGKEREASCAEPVITTSKKLSEAKRNASITEALKKLPKDTSPAEIEAVKAAVPAEISSTQVYTDNPSVGDPPKAADDPDGSKFDAWAKKVKEVGCVGNSFRSGGGRLAAPSAYTAGTMSCTNSNTLKNSVGGTLAKVTQTSSWYSDWRGLPSNPRKSYSTPTGWGWSKDGPVQGGGPTVTVSYGAPLQYYNWTGQNFHFEYFNIELYSWYGEIEQWFGYSKYGPRCSILWWWP